jgi:hypothetical protein
MEALSECDLKKIYVFIRKYANVFDERLREVKKGEERGTITS